VGVMSKKIYVAVTVGTSLIDNLFKKIPLEKDENLISFRKKKIKEIEENLKEYLEKYGDDVSSAELNSICKFRNFRNVEKNFLSIFLITTEGTKKIAEVLKERLCNKGYDVRLENTDFSLEESKIKDSIREFFNTLKKLKALADEENAEFVILSSGGYKILSDYSYLFSTIFKVPVYYVHEKMSKLVSIPLAPLYWDYRVFVNMTTRLKKTPEFFDPLELIKDSIEEIKYDLIYNEPVVDMVKDDSYREILKSAIPIWHNLWIGDLIPETVEHSQKHSRRLLERFEMILEDFRKSDFDFFEEYELETEDEINKFLFLLIASAYLHDIGHTVLAFETEDGEFKSLKNFPEVVREFHNVFSVYEISRKRNFLELEKLNEKLFNALRLVVLYHRKKMNLVKPLDIDFSNYKERYAKDLLEKTLKYENKLDYSPLVENKIFHDLEDEKIKKITLKVAAFLKFLDELDVQADRVVDKYYQSVRQERTKEEVEEIIKLKNLSNYEKFLEFNEEAFKKLEDLRKEKYNEMYKRLFDGYEIDQQFELANEIKIIFKISQFEHFKKHSSIEYVIPEIENGKLIIKISGKDENICDEVKKDIEDQINRLKKDQEEKKLEEDFGKNIKLLPFDFEKITVKIDKPKDS
jgi:putative CRISPR-associated protein (TIGR02619 family)